MPLDAHTFIVDLKVFLALYPFDLWCINGSLGAVLFTDSDASGKRLDENFIITVIPQNLQKKPGISIRNDCIWFDHSWLDDLILPKGCASVCSRVIVLGESTGPGGSLHRRSAVLSSIFHHRLRYRHYDLVVASPSSLEATHANWAKNLR